MRIGFIIICNVVQELLVIWAVLIVERDQWGLGEVIALVVLMWMDFAISVVVEFRLLGSQDLSNRTMMMVPVVGDAFRRQQSCEKDHQAASRQPRTLLDNWSSGDLHLTIFTIREVVVSLADPIVFCCSSVYKPVRPIALQVWIWP